MNEEKKSEKERECSLSTSGCPSAFVSCAFSKKTSRFIFIRIHRIQLEPLAVW